MRAFSHKLENVLELSCFLVTLFFNLLFSLKICLRKYIMNMWECYYEQEIFLKVYLLVCSRGALNFTSYCQIGFCKWIHTLTRILYRSLIPTRMAKVDPGSRGMHRHSPYWWAKLRSKQHGTKAPRIPASTGRG